MSDKQWSSVRFVPGSATALVGRNFVALVASPLTHPLVDAWKDAIEVPETATGLLLDALRGCSLEDLPGFALVLWDGGALRTFVRGDVGAEIYRDTDDGAGVDTLEGDHLLTWAEGVTPRARQVRLAMSGSDEVDFDGTLYTASLGVLPAVGVEMLRPLDPVVPGRSVASGETLSVGSDRSDVDDDPDRHQQEPGAVEGQQETGSDVSDDSDQADVSTPPAGADVADDPEAPDEPGAPAEQDGPAPEGDRDPDPPVDDPRLTLSAVPGGNEPGSDVSVGVAGTPSVIGQPPVGGTDDPGASGLTGNYDELFGSTMIRSVEEAAVRGVDEQPEVEPGGDDDDPAHDGMTIAASDLRKLRADGTDDVAQASAGGPDGPSVLAVTCAAGHANAPHAMSCRVCGLALDQQSPKRIPRPVIGKFVFESGEQVAVDRTILIGRSPKVTGLVPDGHPPELVTVESPNKDVSRTHLEIRIEGWSVLAIDLNSANGTMVTNPGRPAQRLRPGEPFILGIGSTIRLADEVEFNMVAP